MTIEELYESVPGQLRVTPDTTPPEIAECFEYVTYCDALWDQGVPETEIPAFDVWRADRCHG